MTFVENYNYSEQDACYAEESDEAEVFACKPILQSEIESASFINTQQGQDSELETLQGKYQETMDALKKLAEGVRIVTRQMKQQQNYSPPAKSHEYEYNEYIVDTCSGEDEKISSTNEYEGITAANSTDSQSTTTTTSFSSSLIMLSVEDEKRLNDLSQSLNGTGYGSDLVGLSLTANMVNERARMATNEASVLTEDMNDAHQATGDALEQAQQAMRTAERLHRENKKLKSKLEEIKVERKVLCREVKALREENTYLKSLEYEAKRQETLLALEQHLHGALQVHEQQLLSANERSSCQYAAITATQEGIEVNTLSKEKGENDDVECLPRNRLTVKIESPDDLLEGNENEDPIATSEKTGVFRSIIFASSKSNMNNCSKKQQQGSRNQRKKRMDNKKKKNMEAKISILTPTSESNNIVESSIVTNGENKEERKKKARSLDDFGFFFSAQQQQARDEGGEHVDMNEDKTIDSDTKLQGLSRRQLWKKKKNEMQRNRKEKLIKDNATESAPAVLPSSVICKDSEINNIMLSPLPGGDSSPISSAMNQSITNYLTPTCNEEVLRSLALPEDISSSSFTVPTL